MDEDDGAVRGVRRLLITHVDPAGIERARLFPAARFDDVLASGFAASVSSAAFFTPLDAPVDAVGTDAVIGDLRVRPDATRLAALDEVLWHAPADLRAPDGQPFLGCGREAVRRAESALADAGLSARAGLELEFSLTAHGVPAHAGPAYGQRPILRNEAFAGELLEALATAGVPVLHLHAEHGHGQFEVALAHRKPLAACDDYLLARLVVERTALRHSLDASFEPIPPVGAAANGMHIHLSLARDGRSILRADADGIRFEGLSMIAGILDALPALTALLAGSEPSYERLQPGRWSGALACWGPDNREAAIRYVSTTTGQGADGANIEVKPGDATANPYFAVAGLLHAALDGIDRRAEAPAPLSVNPAHLSDDERATRAPRLPATLADSLTALDESRMLRSRLGGELVDLYLAVRMPQG